MSSVRKIKLFDGQPSSKVPRSCAGLRKWRLRDGSTRRAQEGLLKLLDERQSLKRKENWRKLLLLGIQTGDILTKPPFFVAYSRVCRHCRNLAEGGCRLSRFHFRLCRYFLGHVACRNLPWQGLYRGYYMAARGYEFYLPVLKVSLTSERSERVRVTFSTRR